jgi:pimeloyl-ACP methyl ester carboxylesterase
VINGECDSDSRKQFAENLVSQLPCGEYTEIPGSGHLSNLDNPGAYLGVLIGFLERHSPSSH